MSLRGSLLLDGSASLAALPKSSFETGQGALPVTSAPREHSADVQDLGMWQVWQEQPASPSEVSNLELPLWLWMRVQLSITFEVPFVWSSAWPASSATGAEHSSFATVVAEETPELRARLGQPLAVDVPMMEDGLDEAPSKEA